MQCMKLFDRMSKNISIRNFPAHIFPPVDCGTFGRFGLFCAFWSISTIWGHSGPNGSNVLE